MTVSRIKVRLVTRFPSSVSVESPLTLDNSAGNFQFGVSITELQAYLDPLYVSVTNGLTSDLDMNNNDITEVKSIVFQGSTSGTTTVLPTAIAGTTTLTLPAATDTLVGKATTDTLTNKTLTAPVINLGTINIGDSTFSILDEGDNTKKLMFQLSGITTATTRTATVPDADFTMVGTATTQTLTNKTISGSSNTISDIAVASLAAQSAYTLVGNFTGSSAVPTATKITGLTHKAVPVSTDTIIIGDSAVSDAPKYSTLAEAIGALASGVSSIDTATGAITISGLLTRSSQNLTVTAASGAEAAAGSLTTKAVTPGALATALGYGYFMVNRNGSNQTSMTASANNKVQFNNEVTDSQSFYDSATNYRYTPTQAGWYQFVVRTRAAASAGGPSQALIYKNGSLASDGVYTAGATSGDTFSEASLLVQMNGSTDYIEGWVFLPSSVTTLNGTTTSSYMYGYRVA